MPSTCRTWSRCLLVPDSHDSLEHHRRLDTIAASEALTARRRGCNGMQSVAERGLRINRVLQLRKITGASAQKLLLEHDLDHYVHAIRRHLCFTFHRSAVRASPEGIKATGVEPNRRSVHLASTGCSSVSEPSGSGSCAKHHTEPADPAHVATQTVVAPSRLDFASRCPHNEPAARRSRIY